MLENIFKKSSEFDQKNKPLIKESGVVFTDRKICDIIIEKSNPLITDMICEPSVGKGSFVFSLLEYFKKNHNTEELVKFIENNLYCYDINKSFIIEFKLLISEYFLSYGINRELDLSNIKCGDFLLQTDQYDLVIGNPPYVRIQNLDKDYLNVLKKDLKSVTMGNIDLYYAFLEKSLMVSKKVSFIIPNSFIKNKSGNFIRDIIKNRVEYIHNFENNKVWENISTYTSIVICGETKTEFLKYETDKLSINKNKSDLSNDNWIFEDIDLSGNKSMLNYMNSYSGGIATIKDDVFKMDKYDSNYCYKNNMKIEKEFCKKYIKATKSNSFINHHYIIYPYDDNMNIIPEDIVMEKYPLTYKYLLSRKKDLLSRDKGKVSRYDSWYAYGRKQGLLKDVIGTKILIPMTFLKSKGIHIIEVPHNDNAIVMSGMSIDVKTNNLEEITKILQSKKFTKYCELSNKTLVDKKGSDDVWLTINTRSIKEYRF